MHFERDVVMAMWDRREVLAAEIESKSEKYKGLVTQLMKAEDMKRDCVVRMMQGRQDMIQAKITMSKMAKYL